MRKIWNGWLRDTLFVYCGIYTLATIVNSIVYLLQGIYEDPSGNWHELDRAVIAAVIVTAYVLIRYVKLKNVFLKMAVVYVPTLMLAMLYVYMRGLTAELASSAYRDVALNYTAGYMTAAVLVFVIRKIAARRKENT